MRISFLVLLFPFLFVFCSGDDAFQNPELATSGIPAPVIKNTKYLALGDSYTIGESVCETCRYPIQVKDSLQKHDAGLKLAVDIIAVTGWTTTNLKTAIQAQNPSADYDLVTLLIGVNNQYQHKPFSLYEQEFPELVTTAITLAKGNKDHVIVLSIPDYAYTPFGVGTGNQAGISSELDAYNNFASAYCNSNGVRFVNITDITREGLDDPSLVAGDGLHPSAVAYARFAERLRVIAQPFF